MAETAKKEKMRQEMNQIFNLVEKPIMEYIANFLDETPSVIFSETIPEKCDPLILLPIDEYKKNIYLKFTLQNVNVSENNNKRIQDINDIIKHEKVKESIGFLLYSIKSAYPSILASSMINNKPMVHVDLELDETNWTFRPIFKHELTIKKAFLENSLKKIMYIKNQKEEPIAKEMMVDVNNELQNIIKSLEEVKQQLTPEILEQQKNINLEYINKPCIGIFVEEITKMQLPQPQHKQQSNKLKPISDKSYEDCD